MTPTATPVPAASGSAPRLRRVLGAATTGALLAAATLVGSGVPTLLSAAPAHATTSYVVRSGDTLSTIGRRFGVTVAALETANHLSSTVIRVGQTLVIPSASSGTTGTSQVHRKVLVGWSVQHRAIWAYELGDVKASKAVLVLGQMHGNEKAGVATANAIIRDTRPVKGVQLWVIPTLNPDGYAHNTRYNAHGVDLNRNWSYSWARTSVSGRAAMSEPEDIALRGFLLKYHPALTVSIHQPLDGIDAFGVKNVALERALSANLGLPIRSFTCQGGCHGTMTQWINHTTSMAGITVEYTARPTTAFVTVRARNGIVTALGGRY